jgi:hypothetical protein
MVHVREDYTTYATPRWTRPTVERLLLSLYPSHVNGLSAIVLTDSNKADARKNGRRIRGNRRGVVVGRYHPASVASQAWIEIVVDRVVTDLPQRLTWLQLVRDFGMASVLFHEIGHHLHATVGSAARGGELSADDWRLRLSAVHFNRRFWYLRPILPLLSRFARRMAKSARGRRIRRSC